MKIDSHVLFLIVIIGIISAGIVGATVMNTDTSMKQQSFDGITVAVPTDSEFVKVGDGAYKDSNYGITINTFKNNDSMIDFLKNTKKSKIIPIENQPPQSVAFKKGDDINILVTNGNEGISIGSKDGDLTSKMANNVVFSNNHKSQKPAGMFVKQPMSVENDFNLILLLVAEVDTKVFNLDLVQNNLVIVADDYNEDLSQPDDGVGEEDSQDLSDIEDADDLNEVLTEPDDNSTSDDKADDTKTGDDDKDKADDSKSDDKDDDVAQATTVEESNDNVPSSDVASASNAAPDSSNAPADTQQSSSSSSSSKNKQEEMSVDDCMREVEKEFLKNHPELSIDSKYDEVPNGYVFYIVDNTQEPIGTVTIDATTGQMEPDNALRAVL